MKKNTLEIMAEIANRYEKNGEKLSPREHNIIGYAFASGVDYEQERIMKKMREAIDALGG